MAAVTADQLTVAVVEAGVEVNPVGATHTACVLNWAVAAAPTPEVQVAVTLQSYKLPEARPLRLAVVVVCAVERLVQVEELFNL